MPRYPPPAASPVGQSSTIPVNIHVHQVTNRWGRRRHRDARADRLAGVYVQDAEMRGLPETGDLTEAVTIPIIARGR